MSTMIPDPEAYFKGFIPERSALLKALETEAYDEEIPIIGPVVGELLNLLVKVTQAEKVLELGTATGYSGIFMANALKQRENGHLITIELSEGLIERAQKNFEKAVVSDRVTIEKGDCREVMLTLTGPFDMIFMDIDKQYYSSALPFCHKLLRTGGLLVVDNTAFSDAMEFNDIIFKDKGWQIVNLLCMLPHHSPERDGICLAVKQQQG